MNESNETKNENAAHDNEKRECPCPICQVKRMLSGTGPKGEPYVCHGCETDDRAWLYLGVPGVPPDALKLEIAPDEDGDPQLLIKYQRRAIEPAAAKPIGSNMHFGPVVLEVPIPFALDPDASVDVSSFHGMLRVEFKKTQAAKVEPRPLSIRRIE